jgi:membrane dipeptidase
MPEHPYMLKPASVVNFGLNAAQEVRAQQLHKDIIVFDSLMECSWYDGMVDLCKRGGATAGNLSLGITDMHGMLKGDTFGLNQWWSWDSLVNDLRALLDVVQSHSDDLMICLNGDDIRAAKKNGRIGLMPGVQNTEFLGKDIGRLSKAYHKGLRIVQLTYNRVNFVGSGCMENGAAQYPLSRFGEEVVGELNQLGMLVDTGHSSTATLLAAIDVSEKPIACTHAGVRSMVDQPRSHTDEALIKLADNGGVFGILSTPGALNGKDKCTVHDYLDSIEYAINLIGVDHVGFGTDFVLPASLDQILDGPDWSDAEREMVGVSLDVWPWSDGHKGMENNSGYPNLTRGLVHPLGGRRVFDENFQRVQLNN